MRNNIVIILIIFMGLLLHPVKADPINSINGFTPAKGEAIFVTQYRSNLASNNSFRFGQILVPMVVGYAPTEKLTLIGVLPWYANELRTSADFPSIPGIVIPDQRDGAGLGDIFLYTAYRFYTKNTASASHRFTLFTGLETPTGRNAVSDRFGRLPQGLQPGSRTWDPLIGLGYKLDKVDYKADTYINYKYNTTDDGYSAGNVFSYNLSAERRIWPWKLPEFGADKSLNFIVELNGYWTGSTEVQGTAVTGSANHVLFISPGLQYAYKNTIWDLSVMLPVIKNYSEGSIEPDINLVGGMRIYL